MSLPDPPLLLITDRRQSRIPLLDVVAEVLEGGCRWVSLREKDLEPDRRASLLGELLRMGDAFGATIGVHADIEAAAAVPVGAFHLSAHLSAGVRVPEVRERLGRPLLIGVSTHDVGEVERAARDGADYVTFGPVFESLSKPGYRPRPDAVPLSDITHGSGIPVVALGGITPANAGECILAGAAGVAVMGVVMSASRPRAIVSELIAALRSSRSPRSLPR